MLIIKIYLVKKNLRFEILTESCNTWELAAEITNIYLNEIEKHNVILFYKINIFEEKGKNLWSIDNECSRKLVI